MNAPDVLLFPDVYRRRSVICRVGVEGWMRNAGLAVLGYLRRKGGLGDLNWPVRPPMALSKALSLTGELIVCYLGHVRPDAAEAPGAAGCDTSRVGR